MEKKSQKILIVGATSAIAKEVARIYASQGCQLYLGARNEAELENIAADLKTRGANGVEYCALDLTEFKKQEAMINKALEFLGQFDVVLIAHGTLPDQQACEGSLELTLQEINTNGISVISLLTQLSKQFQEQAAGTVAVITSVAGDRGRASNYIYGSAKSLVSTYLEGFRGMMLPYNVNVLDVRPGFVDTPMTAHIENKGALWAQPAQVANSIVNAINKRRSVIYTPFFWRWIMLIIRSIPIAIFKRLKF